MNIKFVWLFALGLDHLGGLRRHTLYRQSHNINYDGRPYFRHVVRRPAAKPFPDTYPYFPV